MLLHCLILRLFHTIYSSRVYRLCILHWVVLLNFDPIVTFFRIWTYMVHPSLYNSQITRSNMVLVSLHAVEADYTVVFFAAGGKHAPSWNWVWKAYRSLNRKYRKNLKQLVGKLSFFHSLLTNEYLDSTSYILHFFPKVSPGIDLSLNNPHSD